MKLQISKIGAYLKAHLIPSKAASASDAKTVESLRFMAITLLIIGLATSWLGIAPFAYSMMVKFMPEWAAFTLTVFVCALISMLVDFPLGVFIPSLFDKMLSAKKTKLSYYKIAALCVIASCLSYLTMSLSSEGGEMTTKQLFESDKPKLHAIGSIAADSLLHARGEVIRKAAKDELVKAETTDKAILAEAVKGMQTAHYNAVKKFPEWNLHPYHRKGYTALLDKARIDSTNKAAGAANLQNEKERLNIKLAATNAAFVEENEGKKKSLDAEWVEYNHKLTVANLFLSKLGWVATPLFWLICFLTVLMGMDEKGATTTSTGRSFQEATKHITQNLARLKEAIDQASSTSKYAANVIAIYDEVEAAYPTEYKAMQLRHSNLYDVFRREDVSLYL